MRKESRLSTLKRRCNRNIQTYRNATYLLALVILFGVTNYNNTTAHTRQELEITSETTATTTLTSEYEQSTHLSVTNVTSTVLNSETSTMSTMAFTSTETVPQMVLPVSTTSQAVSSESTDLEIPSISCQFKAYMSWNVFSPNSAQYRLQQACWTDAQGIRRCNDDVVIALGSYYTSGVGERFMITLKNGHSFKAIIGDVKADCHTDATNRYNVRSDGTGSLIEFIVDTEKLDDGVRRSGNIGTYAEYAGEIASIQKIN